MDCASNRADATFHAAPQPTQADIERLVRTIETRVARIAGGAAGTRAFAVAEVGLASRTGLALEVTVAAAHRVAVARHVRGAPPDDESMIDGSSGNGHEETLSVPLHDGEPVRLRALAVRPETATDTRVAVRLTLVDGYGNRIAEQEVRLDYGTRQVARLQVSGTGGTFRGRIIDGQG